MSLKIVLYFQCTGHVSPNYFLNVWKMPAVYLRITKGIKIKNNDILYTKFVV